MQTQNMFRRMYNEEKSVINILLCELIRYED
jgi:hypothetical protein